MSFSFSFCVFKNCGILCMLFILYNTCLLICTCTDILIETLHGFFLMYFYQLTIHLVLFLYQSLGMKFCKTGNSFNVFILGKIFSRFVTQNLVFYNAKLKYFLVKFFSKSCDFWNSENYIICISKYGHRSSAWSWLKNIESSSLSLKIESVGSTVSHKFPFSFC